MARQFTDRFNRTWDLDIDTWLCLECEKRTSFKLAQAVDPTVLTGLFADTKKWFEVMWVLVEEQAEKKKFSPQDFARGLAGDATEAAAEALTRALADFAPSRQREVLLAMLERGKEVSTTGTNATLKLIDHEAKREQEKIERELAKKLAEKAPPEKDPPETPESSPTSSPVASSSPASSDSTPSAAG